MAEITERIIEEVRRQKCIYDMTLQEYKNQRKKARAYETIAKNVSLSVPEVKAKWKNLRDSYGKYLKSKITTTGQKASKYMKYSSWPWAAQMEFVRPFIEKGQTESNIRAEIEVDENEESRRQSTESRQQSATDDTEDSRPIDDSVQSVSNAVLASDIHISASEAESEAEINPAASRRRRKVASNRTSNKNASNSHLDRIMNLLEKSPERTSSFMDQLDDLELTFLGYAKSIKKLPPKQQISAKFKISKAIMEEELSAQQDLWPGARNSQNTFSERAYSVNDSQEHSSWRISASPPDSYHTPPPFSLDPSANDQLSPHSEQETSHSVSRDLSLSFYQSDDI